MSRLIACWLRNALCPRLVMGCLALVTVLAGLCAAQEDMKPSEVGEGCLLYKSPIAGRYELVPLVHTDVAIDVRGRVASPTFTQKYSTPTPSLIEPISVSPLPNDALNRRGA